MARIDARGLCLAGAMAAAACLLGGDVRAELATAEVEALSRAYGAGVHAYFANDHQRAYDDLTQAIEAGTGDPRAWYFRGLAALKLGRLDEAEADFSLAADKESQASADWDVSRALERVQGHDRLQLERHRIRARVIAYQQRTDAVRRRYLGIERRQPDVLRTIRPEGRGPDPLGLFTGEEDSATPPAEIVPPPAAEPDDEPVMPSEDAAAEEPAAEEPAAEEPAAEEPAAEEPAAEEPMAEEPMAEQAEAEQPDADDQPAEEPMAEREDAPPADASGEDVFGN